MRHEVRRRLLDVSPEERASIDLWLDEIGSREECVPVASTPIEPWRCLTYLCDHRGFVAHGSPSSGLDRLTPVRADRGDLTEFGNATQVFATPDALWAMWFALLDRAMPFAAGTANSCTRVVDGRGDTLKLYWFAVDRRNLAAGRVLAPGTVYVLESEPFVNRNGEEWGSPEAVRPFVAVEVRPTDWPYRDRIIGYDHDRLQDRLSESTEGFPWFDDPRVWPDLPTSR